MTQSPKREALQSNLFISSFLVTTATGCPWWMLPFWRTIPKWSNYSSNMEPEKEQSVSFSSVCCSFIGDGHFSCCFADCCCFRSFVRSFVRSGIRWQQGIAEFAFGSTAQRSRKTVGREESAVVQSGSSGFGQTRRTVETASAHFAQNEIGTRTAEWVQFNIVLLLSLWILILKMLSSSSSLYIDLIRFDSCNMIYFYL